MRRKLLLTAGLVAGAIVGFSLAALFASLSRSEGHAPETVTVGRGTVSATVNGAGFLVPAQQASLNFQRVGRIVEISVKVGDRVKANTLLARIEGVGEVIDFGQARLLAPFNGVVVAINGQVGDLSGSGSVSQAAGSRAALPTPMLPGAAVPGSPLIVLNAEGAPQAVVSFAEVDVVKLKTDQVVALTFDAIPDLTLKGRVIGISPTGLISANNVVKYHATMTVEGEDARLRPPMSVNASIVVAEAKDVLKVPNSALRQSEGKTFVTRYAEGQETAQEVKIGVVGETETEIKDGVQEGDRLLLTAQSPPRRSVSPSPP